MNKLKHLILSGEPPPLSPVNRSPSSRRSLRLLLKQSSSSSVESLRSSRPSTEGGAFDDSDDADLSLIALEDFDASDAEEEVDAIYAPQKERRKSRLTMTDASSIIGGSSVKHTNANEAQEEKTVGRKVFSFSMPFGNITPMMPSLNFPRKFLSTLGGTLPREEGDNAYCVEELRLRLERQESIDTMEEEFLFKDLKKLQSSRFSAVKRSLTPDLENLIHRMSSKKPPHQVMTDENVFEHINGPVIILGGYRGSILRDAKTKRRLWIPFKVGLNFRQVDLCLGPSDADELRAMDEIIPDGMLSHVGPIDISKKLITRIRQRSVPNEGCVYEFGYDWRLSCDLNAAKLKEFVKKTYTKHGKKVLVIAHSMGGLITHHAMNESPEYFRGVVYAGVPYECPNILGPIRFGDVVLVNNNILTPEANFMMRSSFVFLPTDGRLFKDRETGERYDLDYFDPEVWVKYNLNPLVSLKRKEEEEKATARRAGGDPATPERVSTARSDSAVSKITHTLGQFSPTLTATSVKRTLTSFTNHFASENYPPQATPETDEYKISFSEAFEYLSRTLKRTTVFLQGLDFKPELEHAYPPLAIVYGSTTPSMRHSRVPGEQGIKDGDYYDFAYGHGDGVIHKKWLMPERRGFPVVAKIASQCGHVSLLTDIPAVSHAIRRILEEEKRREGMA